MLQLCFHAMRVREDSGYRVTDEWGPCAELYKINEEVVYDRSANLVAELANEKHSEVLFYKVNPWIFEVMANRLTTITQENGKSKEVNVADRWKKWPQRNEVTGSTYAPNEPLITSQNKLNLWTGWDYEPWDGDVSAWLRLHARIFPDPALQLWSLQWLA